MNKKPWIIKSLIADILCIFTETEICELIQFYINVRIVEFIDGGKY